MRDVREGDLMEWPKIHKIGEGIDLVGRQEWVEYYEQWKLLSIKRIVRKPEFSAIMEHVKKGIGA